MSEIKERARGKAAPRNPALGKRSQQTNRVPQQTRTVLGKCPVCGADIVSGNKLPSCAGNCGFRPGRPRGYRKPVTDDEYRKLFHGESVLMYGFEDNWGGVYNALVRLKGAQAPQTDRNSGQSVRHGDYQVERVCVKFSLASKQVN